MADEVASLSLVPGIDQAISARIEPVLIGVVDEREKLFVVHYLRTGNGAESARLAGYAVDSAKGRASQLLKRERIGKAIIEGRKALSDATGYNLAEAMREINCSIQFAKATKNANAMVKAVELKAKLNGLLENMNTPTTSPLNIQINLG